jgi:hypothetical protein
MHSSGRRPPLPQLVGWLATGRGNDILWQTVIGRRNNTGGRIYQEHYGRENSINGRNS